MNNMILIPVGLAGLVLLYYGAEYLVRGSAALAARCRIPPLIVGLTIVAYGTSAPELFVSTGAAMKGLGDVCVGNIVGSNICNIALILGLTALIAPMEVSRSLIRRDLPVMIVASIAVTALCLLNGGMGRVAGLIFVGGIVLYTVWGILAARASGAGDSAPEPAMGPVLSLGAIVGGLVLLVLGAKMLLAGTVFVERWLGVSDEFIALTVVAVGTSLPELATSVIAARRDQPDIAVGNIIGSNIFNILGILGCSALVAPFKIEGMDAVDFGVMIAMAVCLWPVMKPQNRLGRLEGLLLLSFYAAYLVWLVCKM